MSAEKLAEAMRKIAGYSMSQFRSQADMSAQCVDDAAKAIAAHEAEQEQEQAAEAKPVAFVHWPMSGAPKLVWYSNKALEDAIRKAYDDHQPDLLLYTRPQQPLTDEQAMANAPPGITKHSYLKGFRDAEQAHGIGKTW